jgi:hypothetical protein
MTSAKRIKANRRNARKSTGPKTAAGKARSKMNALKHGLDAQTIVLPGEDEAAFRTRLDAWKAGCAPRNPLEESLIEQAARLSWQLDRAERVQAAHLAERIRLAEEDAIRQAAEALVIGQQLIDGLPAPVFQLPRANELTAGKRLGMPIHPDDPNHPERLLRRLESTADGCQWLLDQWAELRAAIEDQSCWQRAHRLRAVRLLGKEPADALDDPMVQTIYLCSFVLGAHNPRVFDDQAEEMTRRELQYFTERLISRGLSDQMPPDQEAARGGLLLLVDWVVVRLQARAASHAARARAAAASPSLAFDDGPAGDRLRRLQGSILRALLRTVDQLMKVRRHPERFVARSEPAQNVAASPEAPSSCANARNEPNAASRPAAEAPLSEPPPAKNEPQDGPDHPPDPPEAVQHPLGTHEKPADTAHQAHGPGPVERERRLHGASGEPQYHEPDEAHGQECADEPHQGGDESIADGQFRPALALCRHVETFLQNGTSERPPITIDPAPDRPAAPGEIHSTQPGTADQSGHPDEPGVVGVRDRRPDLRFPSDQCPGSQ